MKHSNYVIYILFASTLLSSLEAVSPSPTPSYEELLTHTKNIYNFIAEKRHLLHQTPEIGFEEHETSKIIQNALKEIGVNFTANWGANIHNPGSQGTGVVAQIGTGNAPCVGLRADIDALAVPEINDLEFKSKNPGKMHACGHDVHTAMLLGAAAVLKKYEDQIPGTIKLVFQPAEENGGGALMMINEGLMKQHPPIQNMFGMHVSGGMKTGKLATVPGVSSAAVDDFIITVHGKGGHAAGHHLAIDPITASIQIIKAIYDVYSRELYFQFEQAGVISITHINSSTSVSNIIPEHVQFGGTIRSFHKLDYIKKRINDVTLQVAEAYQCTAEIKYINEPYPSSYNDPQLVDFFKNVASECSVDGSIHFGEPMMGAEDFSFYTMEVPSLFVQIGTGSGDEIPGHPPTNSPAHSSWFKVDERVLPLGSALHCHLALQKLKLYTEEATESNTDSSVNSTSTDNTKTSTDEL